MDHSEFIFIHCTNKVKWRWPIKSYEVWGKHHPLSQLREQRVSLRPNPNAQPIMPFWRSAGAYGVRGQSSFLFSSSAHLFDLCDLVCNRASKCEIAIAIGIYLLNVQRGSGPCTCWHPTLKLRWRTCRTNCDIEIMCVRIIYVHDYMWKVKIVGFIT